MREHSEIQEDLEAVEYLEEARDLYRDLFLAALEKHNDPEEFLANLEVYAAGKKGVSMVWREGEPIGFTIKRESKRIKPEVKAEMSAIKRRWLEITEEQSEADIAPEISDKQQIFGYFACGYPEEMTPAEINVLMNRAKRLGLVEADQGELIDRDADTIGLGGYINTARKIWRQIVKIHVEDCRGCEDLKEVEAVAGLAQENGLLKRLDSGLIVPADHTGNFGWQAWEGYLKAIRRLECQGR